MNIYDRSIEILNKRFRLGAYAAMSSDRDKALAQAIEERLKAIEERLSESKGGQS